MFPGGTILASAGANEGTELFKAISDETSENMGSVGWEACTDAGPPSKDSYIARIRPRAV